MRRRRKLYHSGPPARGGQPPTEPTPIIDLYPNPLPPPEPPVTRESTLADIQTGFASLTEDELALARLWLVGEDMDDICYILRMSEQKARALWQGMRRKVRYALLDEVERAIETPRPTPSNSEANAEAPTEADGIAPA